MRIFKKKLGNVGTEINKYLELRGWTQEDLAIITGVSFKTINCIINQKQYVTVETGFLLASAFETEKDHFIKLSIDDQIKDVTSSTIEKLSIVRNIVDLYKRFPIGFLKNKGLLHCETYEKLTNGLKNLFGKNIIEEVAYPMNDVDRRKIYQDLYIKMAIKTAVESGFEGVLDVEGEEPYNLYKNLWLLSTFSSMERIEKELKKYGVLVIYQPEFPLVKDCQRFIDNEYDFSIDKVTCTAYVHSFEKVHEFLYHFACDLQDYLGIDCRSDLDVHYDCFKYNELLTLIEPYLHYLPESTFKYACKQVGISYTMAIYLLYKDDKISTATYRKYKDIQE
jgi:plasmid maintenance system antidote protein VapI